MNIVKRFMYRKRNEREYDMRTLRLLRMAVEEYDSYLLYGMITKQEHDNMIAQVGKKLVMLEEKYGIQ